MKTLLVSLYAKSQVLLSSLQDEEGQDLVEYALVCALIAFGAIAGMQGLANNLNTAFNTIGIAVTSNV